MGIPFKKPVLLFLFLSFFSIVSQGQPLRLKRATDVCNPDSVVLGRISPNFIGSNLSGLQTPISSLRGSFVVIMVWATDIHSSQVEYPYFKKLRAEYSSKKLQFLDIAVDKDKEDWEFYFRQNPESGLHWYIDPLKPPFSFYLLKRKDRGEHTYFTYTVPQFIILNPEGRIVENRTSFFPSDTARFNRLVRSLPNP